MGYSHPSSNKPKIAGRFPKTGLKWSELARTLGPFQSAEVDVLTLHCRVIAETRSFHEGNINNYILGLFINKILAILSPIKTFIPIFSAHSISETVLVMLLNMWVRINRGVKRSFDKEVWGICLIFSCLVSILPPNICELSFNNRTIFFLLSDFIKNSFDCYITIIPWLFFIFDII